MHTLVVILASIIKGEDGAKGLGLAGGDEQEKVMEEMVMRDDEVGEGLGLGLALGDEGDSNKSSASESDGGGVEEGSQQLQGQQQDGGDVSREEVKSTTVDDGDSSKSSLPKSGGNGKGGKGKAKK